ncbi:hypothetical protein ONS96_009470 [Cadophora gregata f. sp. sojae]|nr:hypothetical protein ONS96_009470 [Cadophora gregata f. sp. sojae]
MTWLAGTGARNSDFQENQVILSAKGHLFCGRPSISAVIRSIGGLGSWLVRMEKGLEFQALLCFEPILDNPVHREVKTPTEQAEQDSNCTKTAIRQVNSVDNDGKRHLRQRLSLHTGNFSSLADLTLVRSNFQTVSRPESRLGLFLWIAK